jgi:hypothetical protein
MGLNGNGNGNGNGVYVMDREMEILRGLNGLVPFVRLIVENTDT